MKKYLTFLFAFSFLGLFAQEIPTKKRNRFQFGVNFSPDACFRTLKNTDGSSTSDFVIDMRNDTETIKFGYTTGVNFQYNLNRFLGLSLGVHYANKGYQNKKIDVVPPTPQPDPALPKQFKFIQNFHTLDLPLKLNFTLGKNKFRFTTGIGAAANFLLYESQTSVIYYSDRTTRNSESSGNNYKKLNFSPFLSVGIDYQINESMNVRMEPTVRYGVNHIIDAPVTGYLFNAGVNVGYYYNF
jgi:hypothetical protein